MRVARHIARSPQWRSAGYLYKVDQTPYRCVSCRWYTIRWAHLWLKSGTLAAISCRALSGRSSMIVCASDLHCMDRAVAANVAVQALDGGSLPATNQPAPVAARRHAVVTVRLQA